MSTWKVKEDAVSILTVALIHIYLLGPRQIFRDCSFPVSSISTTGRIYFLRRRPKGTIIRLFFLSPSNFSVFLLPARRWIVFSLKMQCSRGNNKLSHQTMKRRKVLWCRTPGTKYHSQSIIICPYWTHCHNYPQLKTDQNKVYKIQNWLPTLPSHWKPGKAWFLNQI